jgi:anti-sigma B factor antagonist
MLIGMPIDAKQLDSGVVVVAVSGRLVLGRDLEGLESAVTGWLSQGSRKFVFDLAALDYADSAGIGTVVSCLTQIKKSGGEMRVAAANARMSRLFQMTGVDQLLSLYPNVSEATAG